MFTVMLVGCGIDFTDQMRAINQPIKVHPRKKLMSAIATVSGWPRDKAINVGRKLRNSTTMASSTKPIIVQTLKPATAVPAAAMAAGSGSTLGLTGCGLIGS